MSHDVLTVQEAGNANLGIHKVMVSVIERLRCRLSAKHYYKLMDSFWVFVLVCFGVSLAIFLGIGYVVSVRMGGHEAASRYLRCVIPFFLIGLSFAFIFIFILPVLGKFGWLSFSITIILAVSYGIYLLTWYWRKRQAGSLLLKVGQLSANKFFFQIGRFQAVVATLYSALFIFQVSTGFSSSDSLANSLAMLLNCWTLAIVSVSSGLSKLELRENGICYMFGLIRWETITSYAWKRSQNQNYPLTIQLKRRFRLLPGFRSFPIPSTHRDTVEQILRTHVTTTTLVERDTVSNLKIIWGLAVVATIFSVVIVVSNSLKYPIPVLNSLGIAPTGLCRPIWQGNIGRIKDYLKRGGNPNARVPDAQFYYEEPGKFLSDGFLGTTTLVLPRSLLDCASQEGNKELAELLIAKGADVNAKSQEGITSLHMAADGFHQGQAKKEKEIEAVAKLLIAQGADVNAKTSEGGTPLHKVAKRGWEDMAELLIANGADVNAKDNQGRTPLLDAVILSSQTQMPKLLIAKGADINAKDNQGSTLLHWVAKYRWGGNGRKQMAELLITQGADVNAKDKEGKTPLHWAKNSLLKDVEEVLKSHGAAK
jgi:ankyrin repeat protein